MSGEGPSRIGFPDVVIEGLEFDDHFLDGLSSFVELGSFFLDLSVAPSVDDLDVARVASASNASSDACVGVAEAVGGRLAGREARRSAQLRLLAW